jgi:hypothetical protein
MAQPSICSAEETAGRPRGRPSDWLIERSFRAALVFGTQFH